MNHPLHNPSFVPLQTSPAAPESTDTVVFSLTSDLTDLPCGLAVFNMRFRISLHFTPPTFLPFLQTVMPLSQFYLRQPSNQWNIHQLTLWVAELLWVPHCYHFNCVNVCHHNSRCYLHFSSILGIADLPTDHTLVSLAAAPTIYSLCGKWWHGPSFCANL